MQFQRNPNIEVTEIDNETFLVDPESDKIYFLDEISSGIWRILVDSYNIDSLVEIFGAAFPETSNLQIMSDLTKALEDMSKANIIHIKPCTS